MSTINSYAWYLRAIPSNFSCATFQKNLQNTSRFVTLFSAHGDVVVGFAIFHIVLFQKEKKEKKKRKKGTPPWNRLAMVCGRKRWGGVPSFIKEHQSANLSLSKTCF
jgi:hypothetical protein